MLPVLLRRRFVLAALVITVALLLLLNRDWLPPIPVAPSSLSPLSSSAPIVPAGDHGRFWASFSRLLNETAPVGAAPPKRLEEHPPAQPFLPGNRTVFSLPHYIELRKADEDALRAKHAQFVRAVTDAAAPQLAYRSGSRGIVSTAGDSFLSVLVTSLMMLRKTGSTLPVEIFLAADAEYDDFVCHRLLPVLNARCVVLTDILGYARPLSGGLKKYQFKIFALLFSSFQDVLFLDADAFPLRSPDRLFDSEPFTSTGLVTWPDFWQVSYSPAFFRITGQPQPDYVPYPSTESGQIAVSKRSHAAALLLSAYYNVYGPEHYYPLLSQGMPGEGDKETFIAPAAQLHLPFYTVTTGPMVFGYTDPVSGSWAGGVMVQADPTWDHSLAASNLSYAYDWSGRPPTPPDTPFFTWHANLPKLDPVSVFADSPDGHRGRAYDADGRPRRIWGDPNGVVSRIGFDLEPRLWHALNETACLLERGGFRFWEEHTPSLCARIGDFWREMAPPAAKNESLVLPGFVV